AVDESAEPGLLLLAARGIEGADARRGDDLVAGAAQRLDKEPSDASVARRHLMIRRLERRVEHDAHETENYNVFVSPGPDPGAHVLSLCARSKKTWMAGSSPAKDKSER